MKNLLGQTTITSQSFDQWWRETGQFIGVAAQATGDELELLRRYAVEAMKDVRSATEWQELESNYDSSDKRVDELTLLREEIVEVMEAATTPEEKVDAMWKVLNENP